MSALFVIAILSCGDDGRGCQPATTLPTTYATRAACEAATDQALLDLAGIDGPLIVANCRKAPRAAQLMPADPRPAPSRGAAVGAN